MCCGLFKHFLLNCRHVSYTSWAHVVPRSATRCCSVRKRTTIIIVIVIIIIVIIIVIIIIIIIVVIIIVIIIIIIIIIIVIIKLIGNNRGFTKNLITLSSKHVKDSWPHLRSGKL